jgi:hypothetical protein
VNIQSQVQNGTVAFLLRGALWLDGTGGKQILKVPCETDGSTAKYFPEMPASSRGSCS